LSPRFAHKQADGERVGADYYYATSDAATFETLKSHFDLIITTVSAVPPSWTSGEQTVRFNPNRTLPEPTTSVGIDLLRIMQYLPDHHG